MQQYNQSPQRNQGNNNNAISAIGGKYPLGIDKNILSDKEINKLLEITSEKSLQAIARETELLAGESSYGGNMVRGDMKVTLKEIEDFMREVSEFNAVKVTRKDLMQYLSAFPQKAVPGANQNDPKPKKTEVQFLMNGKPELEASELFELLSTT